MRCTAPREQPAGGHGAGGGGGPSHRPVGVPTAGPSRRAQGYRGRVFLGEACAGMIHFSHHSDTCSHLIRGKTGECTLPCWYEELFFLYLRLSFPYSALGKQRPLLVRLQGEVGDTVSESAKGPGTLARGSTLSRPSAGRLPPPPPPGGSGARGGTSLSRAVRTMLRWAGVYRWRQTRE